ncbi:forkhead box protein P3 isoform X2 [Rhinichthys klamathensis goyatoka]|uniref:forkhead box protein P3 isoform X2 n=1 Tax=Rhinichthys klamathensis goyatoka TaxID=3034132 RepID=UPI0024B4A73C|nr:forkhead box protein P3 isoform X2 [Rhinichthys klamathensis goyatoka]
MPRSERESEKRVSGRENERQPQLKEERDASPPLMNERSSHQCVEDLSSAVRSNSAPQTVGSVQLSHTAPSNNSTYLKHPVCQRTGDEERMHFFQLLFQNSRAGQIRPSVLRSTALLLQANDSHPAAMNRRKETDHSAQISIQAVADRKQSPSLHHQSPVQTEIQRSSSLYINGQCRWPGCDKVFEGYTHFLRHLNRDHSTDEKTIAQWRVQQDLVRHMENQGVATGRWRPLAPNLPPLGEPDGRTERAREAPVQQDPWHIPPPHMLPDFVSSVEYYKYANIRPPYTYAFLIRWSIMEATEKQRTLNEIYNWFTRMFYYFRHSSPTWKNAVRHNLSLHKCFVRVDGRMGAVWTVDEEEFQKRKGQKINRDYTLNWLTPFSNCRSHEASDV